MQLQHANSAVVLTTIKILLYLMNYMDNKKLVDLICKKMGPPLGNACQSPTVQFVNDEGCSNTSVLRAGGAICRLAEHLAHNPETAGCPQE